MNKARSNLKIFRIFALVSMILLAAAFIAGQLNLVDLSAMLSTSKDADQDGLTNTQERRLGTNPRDSDTDNGGTRDGTEVDCGTAPLMSFDDYGDLDDDGLVEYLTEEYEVYTCISQKFLTDLYGAAVIEGRSAEDFVPDGDVTLTEGLLLTVENAGLDGDADGLTLFEELALGTDYQDSDTDDDGVSDGDEVDNGTDPLDPDSN